MNLTRSFSFRPWAMTAGAVTLALAGLTFANPAEAGPRDRWDRGGHSNYYRGHGHNNYHRNYYRPYVSYNYVAPRPVYYAPAPVYYQPAPVYYQPGYNYYPRYRSGGYTSVSFGW